MVLGVAVVGALEVGPNGAIGLQEDDARVVVAVRSVLGVRRLVRVRNIDLTSTKNLYRWGGYIAMWIYILDARLYEDDIDDYQPSSKSF